MTERIVIAVVLAAVAIGFALVVQRRRPDAPTASTASHEAPAQLDRADFERPDAPWLVAVFTSATCNTCAGVWTKAQVLESDQVAVQQIEVGTDPDLHRRYAIGAVPMTVIADVDGVVRTDFAGPVSSTHLWAAVADLREPGTD